VVVPKETPQAVQDLYRAAFTRIFADPEYKEKRGTVIGEYDEVTGAAAEKAYAAGTVISEETRQWLKDWLLRRFNHRIG
jgi:tripartite-type tricarboxylate transporter receptor subunit TctC